MGITTQTREKVATALQEHGLGLGLTIPQLRKAYPAGAVRRTAILEALQDLEAMGHIEWHNDQARWVGPLTIERVFGEPLHRIQRDRTRDGDERIQRAADLSSLLLQTEPFP